MDFTLLFKLLEMFVTVFFWSLTISTPILVLIGVVSFWDQVKKKREKEQREAERIIVKKNEDVIKLATGVNVLEELKIKLDYQVLKLRQEKSELSIELGKEDVEIVNEVEEIDYSTKTVKELHDIFKGLGLKGYSRLSKDELIDKLSGMTLSETTKED